MKDSGWRFDKVKSRTIYFYKTIEVNGSGFTKILLRNSAILNFQDDDNFCFFSQN